MLKNLKRWIQIRDGKAQPVTWEELSELVAFEMKCQAAWEEQAYAQRRPPREQEVSKKRRESAGKIINLVRSFTPITEPGP